ncbi:hypothetical protein CD175_02125 [Pseudomonas laurylsulfatiphila]|uniref:Uncharacterized protein n=1 Tax=Pseudomonas laurylsulfatiphila TaxID=2011015 RepID=A0A2S6FS91_9PSED|nr:hypothetical protein CD175_02125 [Pseudomonas laurylsulfatiphila]
MGLRALRSASHPAYSLRTIASRLAPTKCRCVFKDIRGYFAKATQPCVVAYRYARIRRLVRLGPGFYRLPVAG